MRRDQANAGGPGHEDDNQSSKTVTMGPLRDALMLELRVALSPRAQPIWFRVLKWTITIGLVVYFWGAPGFWWWVAGALGVALTVHFVWRAKTKRWTQPWGGWKDVEAARDVTKEAGGHRR